MRRPPLLAALLASALLACDRPEAGAPAAETPGPPAPEFELPRLDGGSLRLADQLGKTVVIDFWATWCPPCEFQVPELNRLHEAHAATGDVVVIGVAIDVDGAAVVGPWVKEHGVAYPILLGDGARLGWTTWLGRNEAGADAGGLLLQPDRPYRHDNRPRPVTA